jgi:hypothetical protein
MLEIKLQDRQLSAFDRSELEIQVRRLKEEIGFFRTIREAKEELIYNLGTWTAKRYSEKKIEPAKAREIIAKVLPYFFDFKDLTKLRLMRLTQDWDYYNWTLWEAGPGATKASQSWLTQFYVLAAARVLRTRPTEREEEEIYQYVDELAIQSSSLEIGGVRNQIDW